MRNIKAKIAVVFGVALLMLASVVTYAEAAGPDNNPIQNILNGVLNIQQQTTDISAQTTKLQDQTAGVSNQLDQVIATLGKIQVTPQPTPGLPLAAHRVWVSPYWLSSNDHSETPVHLYPINLSVFNPGNVAASADCLFFGPDGTQISTLTKTLSLSPGQTGGTCSQSVLGGTGLPNSGWLLITSDQPVIPYGWLEDGSGKADLSFYPVDCSDPSYMEYVCGFVN